MSATLTLLKELIRQASITPTDADCQTILMTRLTKAGFQTKPLLQNKVHNLWAWHGSGEPTFIFAGHTDVVPPGAEDQWDFPPFVPTEHNGYLYGRGATDMKSGLSAMIVAAENFVKNNPHHKGTLGFIITSDEEGPAVDGTQKVVDYLQQQNIPLHYCVVGEASSNQQLGDAIKIGRRGSMYGELIIFGKQGHIAYPHLSDNPIHRSFQALDALAKTTWDTGNKHFTPTSFQIYKVHADGGAANIIPNTLKVYFNFRYAPIHPVDKLQQQCQHILNQYQLKYDLQWNVSSLPFFSGNGKLATVCSQAIQDICHIHTVPNTYGGTSDGRFIAPTGCEVIELGPVNESAHKVNEHIKIADLNKLTQVYQRILELML